MRLPTVHHIHFERGVFLPDGLSHAFGLFRLGIRPVVYGNHRIVLKLQLGKEVDDDLIRGLIEAGAFDAMGERDVLLGSLETPEPKRRAATKPKPKTVRKIVKPGFVCLAPMKRPSWAE